VKAKYFTKPGDVFGAYTVLVSQGRKSFCRCRCGSARWVLNKNLCTRPNPKCRECFASLSRFQEKVVHAAYNAIARCIDQQHARYADWGGRGIGVAMAWVNDVVAFCTYLNDLHGADNPRLVLDRIDNDGDYMPGNLRWTTRKESQKNRRNPQPRSVAHRRSLSLARRGKPWSQRQRAAYNRRKSISR